MTTSPGLGETPAVTGAPASQLSRRLYRSRTNRSLAGVCGGIAEYYGADPTAVRLLAVLVALFTAIFPMLVLYLIAAIVIPERVEGDLTPAARGPGIAVSPGQGGLVLGILLVGVGMVALANEVFRVDWDMLWPVALIVLGGALVLAARRR